MNRKFYITTPIYYVNDVPHIGHAYTTIAADVAARYRRLDGDDVFFLTGTDEHGQKVQQAAEQAGRSAQAYVDALHKPFKDLWARFNISNTDFIRTTEERHTRVVREILQALHEKGEIYRDSYEGWYCMPDERFWTEKDLVEGNCPECGRKVEKIKEYNYFFKMSQYQEWLIDHIQKNESFILPASRKNEILGFLKKPLEDLCISRPKERLAWGIPLPFDEDYVTYVWFDALINYISIHGSHDEILKCDYWPAAHHLIGKDILTTHAVYWSTMLKAIGISPPLNIFAHGWWTVEGKKMSKSLRNVVEPNLLIDQFGVDVIRYFLMREVPFGLDGDFSHKALIGRVNSDLANNLGNLLNRTLNMLGKYFEGRVPEIDVEGDEDAGLKGKSKEVVEQVNELYDELAYNRILMKIWELLDASNQYINSTAPWNLAKSDDGKKRLATVLYNAAEACRVIAILIHPFMPDTSKKMMQQLGVETPIEDQGLPSIRTWGWLSASAQSKQGEQIFPRIEDKAAEKILATVEVKASGDDGAAAVEEDNLIQIDDFMRLDLRVALILEAEKVKKSKKLIKLKVDLGHEQRQVVAGIAESYEPEQLVGRKVILVANLKPAKLMGIESQGMILAGSDQGKVVLAGFDEELELGARVK
ncbi:methionine--tRNA ligase [Nitrospina watsonii]|uniref:Methionine--tRNA ligase n=1 Tax=Nitrospina watsonii TaxID=1323948 RepID=A0ABN8VXY5_9BACT|nr:methionine--tRNA ligase [Nitrospina watsonii]CAI2718056.1 Methionine--tRNA ligase [Nitrospina watsonii]